MKINLANSKSFFNYQLSQAKAMYEEGRTDFLRRSLYKVWSSEETLDPP